MKETSCSLPLLISKTIINIMKTKIFSVLAVAAMLSMASCEPTEYRQDMADFSYDTTTVLDLTAEGVTEGSNELTLRMNTEGVYGYWEHGSSKTYSDVAHQIEGAKGNYTYTFHILNTYADADTVIRGFKQTVDYEVTKTDVSPGAMYEILCGQDLSGKTWVFDQQGTIIPDKFDKKNFWFKSNPQDYTNCWWNGYTPPTDVNGELTFNYSNGPVAIYKSSPSGTETVGSYTFNTDFTEFSFLGDAKILGDTPNNGSVAYKTFKVCELTETTFILQVTSLANGATDAWTWVFIAK